MRWFVMLIFISFFMLIPVKGGAASCSGELPCFGTSLSPRSYESEDFVTFLDEAVQIGSILNWAGNIDELESNEGAPYIVPQIAENAGLMSMVQLQVFDVNTGTLIGLDRTGDNRVSVEQVRDFAEVMQVDYLAFGVEVNLLEMRNPDGFAIYLATYEQVMNVVRDVAPQTTIVAVLQYEQLIGYRGGIFGGENNPDPMQIALVEAFDSADIIGFTTYPGLIFTDPSHIPDDYYAPLREIDYPIAFTEIGWQSDDTVGSGWESSEVEQAMFVERFASLTEELCPTFYLWSFVYDQDTFAPFNSMGLRDADGNARPSWQAWLDFQTDATPCLSE